MDVSEYPSIPEFRKRLNWTRPPERIKGGVFSSKLDGDSINCCLRAGRRVVRHSVSVKDFSGDLTALATELAMKLCSMWDQEYGMPLLEHSEVSGERTDEKNGK